ncbi:MAG: primosomal protein N' [Paramuribaculum sp.]|nr:primosomal protein N' [Paramuribaculum sp.]
MLYAEVILPLPLNTRFTYRVSEEHASRIKIGSRVIVPFGVKKFYTAIVTALTRVKPEGFEVKEINMLLDENPVVIRPQIQLWDWVADYYMCAVGDVMKAALPAGLKVESETFVSLAPDFDEDRSVDGLGQREVAVIQQLAHEGKAMSVTQIEKATGFTAINALICRMIEQGKLVVSEKLVERYVSKKITCVRVSLQREDADGLHRIFESLKQSPRQLQAFMALLELSGFMRKREEVSEVILSVLQERTGISRQIINELQRKGYIEIYKKEINRFKHDGRTDGELPVLSPAQNKALAGIHASWHDKDVTLLHGVTSSGKTEIYMHLIDDVMRRGRQVLYLVPEIALTTQLTERLQRVFGDKVVIYHSKFSDNERVDLWRKVLGCRQPMVVIGARSALFLPFYDLGLVIVDEEHETSYKQQDPAPRYNGRDTAMVLARMHGAKTLLGSATPAIDTYYKATTGRYGLVTLAERYSGVLLPEIELIDLSKQRRITGRKTALSHRAEELVGEALTSGMQAIVFLNRRGYAPVAVCKQCAWTPKCECCDVSLTYHKRIDKLVCHYCGALYPLPVTCPNCKEPAIEIFGYGTERMEDEVDISFPDAKVLRMDLDTTRSKDDYQNIIEAFSQKKADILVGTQMITKGLDFDNVRVAVIINADAMINQPDFRASERAFNMLMQVSGRAGRRSERGIVALQTYQPEHPLLQYVLNHDYTGFYEMELTDRKKYNYPPFTKVINVYMKHRERDVIEELSIAYGRRLRELFGNRVFGPEEPPVGRIQSMFIRRIMLKVEINASMSKVKEILRGVTEEMHVRKIRGVKSAIVYYDVDPY